MLTGNEPGAAEVQTYLTEAIAERIRWRDSFASLTEVDISCSEVKQHMLPPKSGASGS